MRIGPGVREQIGRPAPRLSEAMAGSLKPTCGPVSAAQGPRANLRWRGLETLIKALVRATPLAAPDRERPREVDHRPCGAQGVTDAYVCRVLPLTCLAPDIVEAILDGRQPKGLRLAEMLGNGPIAWEEQSR
jgi:hypothetical protein